VAERPTPRILLGVGLIAGCVLAFQVLLTRLFSSVLYYHFSFLAISLALVGTGAGGLIVYAWPRWFDRSRQALVRLSAGFAVLLVLVPLGIVRIHYSLSGTLSAGAAARLALACVLAALPFTAGGITIAAAIRQYPGFVGRVYGADLLGAGIGAVAVVPVMWLASPATLTVSLGVFAAAASALFAPPRRRSELRLSLIAGTMAIALTVLAATTSLYFLAPWTGRPVVAERWTPLARVIGDPPPHGVPFALLFYDRAYAPVWLYRRGTPYPSPRALHLQPQSLGYAIAGRGRTLVIGGGGGRDILNALASGERRIDVIELNSGIVQMVDHDLARWSGSPYTLPGVHTAVGDGRSVLAQRRTRYTVIHIGFTDTLSANAATAFALTEENLYTLEAFQEYLDHLTPDGILDVSRLYKLTGDEALRITVLALEALRRRGVQHPGRNLVVVLGHDVLGELFGTTLAKLRPWTPQELARLRRLAAAEGLSIAYAPGGPYRLEWASLARASSPQAFCSHYQLNVCPPTDDKPFFFNMTRLANIGRHQAGYIYVTDPLLVLALTLAILLGLGAIALVAPLLLRRPVRPSLTSLSYFLWIGLGYLILEVVLIQRFVLFLGFPTYSLSVVLSTLLVFTGVGSLVSARARGREPATLRVGLGVVALAAIALAFGLAPLLEALISLTFALRVILTVAILAPVGVAMGVAMPLGLGRLESLHPGGTPWAWAVNGIASVVASVLAIVVAIELGFRIATLVAAACYGLAMLHAIRAAWPRRAGAPPQAAVDRSPLSDPLPAPRA
jgi:hypothetical protein